MLIKNNGIEAKGFIVPAFELNEKEIVVIRFFNDSDFYETEMYLKDIFTGKISNENVIINTQFTFVEHIKGPTLRNIFYPVTVGKYLKKYADMDHHYSSKIYEEKWITKKTKLNNLGGTARKLLSLYATLSQTNNIVLDLVGLDPENIRKIYEIVKDNVKKGGSAILFDYSDDMKNDCTTYIELERSN